MTVGFFLLDTDTVASPSSLDFSSVPAWAVTTSAISASWRSSAAAIAVGASSHNADDSTMSVSRKVTTPEGRAVVIAAAEDAAPRTSR